MKKFNKVYKGIVKEGRNLFDFFEDYQDIGMSADSGIMDLIDSITEQIVREVPEERWNEAHGKVRSLLSDRIYEWKKLEVNDMTRAYLHTSDDVKAATKDFTENL